LDNIEREVGKQGKEMKIIFAVEGRDDVAKLAALVEMMKGHNERSGEKEMEWVVVHCAEKREMRKAAAVFEELEMRVPKWSIAVGKENGIGRLAEIMMEQEKVYKKERPDIALVIGESDTALACALMANRYGIPVGHIEAGLRNMMSIGTEEMNRILMDNISEYLFTSSEEANVNLRKEGKPDCKVSFVGNLLIDTMLRFHEPAKRSRILNKLNFINDDRVVNYAMVSLQNSSTMDDLEVLAEIFKALIRLAKEILVVMPVHSKIMRILRKCEMEAFCCRRKLRSEDGEELAKRILVIPVPGYIDNLSLLSNAKLVLTDSGAVQEQTTFLGIPCLTLKDSTERNITLRKGTNMVAGTRADHIAGMASQILKKERKYRRVLKYWDGRAALRIGLAIEAMVRKG
jgi:UDP-N-acetylglucosamine 2-epimerase (non-hydrolysing)